VAYRCRGVVLSPVPATRKKVSGSELLLVIGKKNRRVQKCLLTFPSGESSGDGVWVGKGAPYKMKIWVKLARRGAKRKKERGAEGGGSPSN